jgi:hypothetical protein
MTARIVDIDEFQSLTEEERTVQRVLGAYEIISATDRQIVWPGEEPDQLLAIGRNTEASEPIAEWFDDKEGVQSEFSNEILKLKVAAFEKRMGRLNTTQARDGIYKLNIPNFLKKSGSE